MTPRPDGIARITGGRMMRRKHGCRRVRRGSLLVEFALILPLMTLMLVAIVEYAVYITMRHWVTNAAREGAHLAAVSTSTEAAALNIPDIVTGRIEQLGLPGLVISPPPRVYSINADGTENPAWGTAAFGAPVVVDVSATYTPVISSVLVPVEGSTFSSIPFMPSSLPTSARSTAIRESD